jgi:anti-sigma28 factor (negative regulator of flagellin synthesis)
MKPIDNGFTERVATSTLPATGIGSNGNNRADLHTSEAATGDGLQLSSFAARLNGDLSAETTNRADRVNQIAKAVNSGGFQIDAAAVSRSMVSEALQGRS